VNNKIHILQLVYSFDVEGTGGGITRFVLALSQELDKHLFDITICGLWNMSTPGESERIQELNSQGIRAFTAADWDSRHPMQSLIRSYRKLVNFTRAHSIDIIHSHSEFSDVIALLLKLFPGSNAIVRTLHNGYQLEWRMRPGRRLLFSNILYPLFYNAEIGVADHVVHNLDCRWLAQRLNRKAYLLRNAIDSTRFRGIQHMDDKSSLGLGIPQQAFVIGTVGRLREEKGYNFLLDAASLLIPQIDRPSYFIIVGTGDLEDALITQAKAMGIDKQVIFTGPRGDIEYLLSGMDLFVCSSLWEGFSTAVLEAMAAGVPVLVTDIPGNRELIEPNVSGWMVVPGNASELCSAMIKIIDAPSEQLHMVIQAAMDKASEFSIEKVVEQHEQYYKDWLGKK
jgi:glycosyltransferase involved in cell wall biosynthesis